jgi:ribosomal protein S4
MSTRQGKEIRIKKKEQCERRANKIKKKKEKWSKDTTHTHTHTHKQTNNCFKKQSKKDTLFQEKDCM